MTKGFPDWSGPKVGVYLQPEWAAKEAIDFNMRGVVSVPNGIATIIIDYTVPVGKTVFICQLGQHIYGITVVIGSIYLVATAVDAVSSGGYGGFFCGFSKPIRMGENVHFRVYAMQFSGAPLTVSSHLGGYTI